MLPPLFFLSHSLLCASSQVGLIQADMKPEERRVAYLCDVTYVTNSELGFDYLRDNLAGVGEAVLGAIAGAGFHAVFHGLDLNRCSMPGGRQGKGTRNAGEGKRGASTIRGVTSLPHLMLSALCWCDAAHIVPTLI